MTELNQSNEEKEKNDRVNKEIKRIERLFKNLPKDKIKTVSSLIKNAAFMTITLEDLQDEINKNGVISHYKNGENQYGTKKSPEVEIYNTMIKNHMAIMKQLTDLLPNGEETKKVEDELVSFIKRAK